MPSAYWTLLKMKVSQTLQYRGDMFIYTIEGIISAVVALVVWLSIASAGGSLPFNRNELITYYMLVLIVGTWTNTWSSHFVANDIRQGKLSPYLVKPISYSANHVGNNIAEKLQKTVILIPIAALLLFFFGGTLVISTSILSIIAFTSSLLLAATLYFVIDFCIGLFAFWTGEVYAIYSFYAFGFSVFSGELVPVDFLPAWANTLSFWLPFRYVLSLPIEILQGRVIGEDLVYAFLLQVSWLLVSIVCYRLLWTRGVRDYSSVGS